MDMKCFEYSPKRHMQASAPHQRAEVCNGKLRGEHALTSLYGRLVMDTALGSACSI